MQFPHNHSTIFILGEDAKYDGAFAPSALISFLQGAYNLLGFTFWLSFIVPLSMFYTRLSFSSAFEVIPVSLLAFSDFPPFFFGWIISDSPLQNFLELFSSFLDRLLL